MEDSFEDFIKITRNVKDIHKNSKDRKEVRNEVLITLQKKQECEARAVKIVEFLIEGKLRPEVFLRCLKHINQSYYQDVVEERAITKLCGYSLCGKQIPEMPKKQYYINSKINKIYDVTDRKNYCSNFCYKASIHIKQQIDDGPLWMRKLEDNSTFNLLPPTERGLPGVEIDQGMVKPVKDPVFTSVTSFAEISLTEMDETGTTTKTKKPPNKYVRKPEIMQTLHESEEITNITKNAIGSSRNCLTGGNAETITEEDYSAGKSDESNLKLAFNLVSVSNEPVLKNTIEDINEVSTVPRNNSKNDFKASASGNEETIKVIEEANLDCCSNSAAKIDIKSSTSDPKLTSNLASASNEPMVHKTNEISTAQRNEAKIAANVSKSKKRNEISDDVLQNIKKFVYEWITLETYIFLYGESKVKEMLNETEFEEYFKTIKKAESTAAQQRKYIEICRKLHFNQLAEDKFDRAIIGIKMKPVPDFAKLKEESKSMNLKVRSFYGGVSYESDKQSENKSTITQADVITNYETTQPEVMPLVDNNSQTAIRRKVYLNSISRTMANLIPNLGIPSHYVMDELQSLVKTFKLQAHNVVFAPAIRMLIALILIKMLSIRDSNLKIQLETKRVDTFIKLMLSHFPNGQEFLNDLFENIADISLFLDKYFTINEM